MISNTTASLEKGNYKDSVQSEESLNVIYKDALKYAPSKILGAVMNVLSVSIYTNLLLPNQYGLYMVATSVISFLAIIFSDWIGVSALRFFREHFNKDNIESYFSTIFLLLIINLSTMYVASYLFFNPIQKFFEIPSKFLLLVLVLLFPIAIRALLFQVLRAQIKPLTYTFSVILNQIMTTAIAVLLIMKFHIGASSILIGMFVSIVFIDLILFALTRYHDSINHEKIHFETLSGLYKYGIPVALSNIGMWTITQSNRFILQHFKGSSFNGQLGVGYNLTYSLMMPLFSIITMAAIPRLMNLYEDGKDVKPLITKLTEIYFTLFLPITIFLCIYSKDMVHFFSGSNFSNSFILIPFLAISAFCLGLTELTTIQYYLIKKTTIDMWIRLVSGLFGIILNIILLPKFGLLAVGLSALASQFLYLLLSCFIKINIIKWDFPFRSAFKSFSAIILCFGFSLILQNIASTGSILGFISHTTIFFGTYILLIKKMAKITLF